MAYKFFTRARDIINIITGYNGVAVKARLEITAERPQYGCNFAWRLQMHYH